MIAKLGRKHVLAVSSFLVLLVLALFLDALRVQREALDPGSLSPVATGLRRHSKQIVLILIDSLAERIGNNPDIMPNLVALGRLGAHGTMIAPPDTVTTAGVRAMTVGTKPGFADTLELFSHHTYSHWTVFDELVARGEEVAFFGDHSWTDLLGDRAKDQPSITKAQNLFADEETTFREAREHLTKHAHVAFTALHIAKTDFYAHQYGTERAEYRKVLRDTDEEIAKFIRELVDQESTVIVTSDHGNDYFGNHGGSGDIYRRVPIVLAGAGIRKLDGFEMEGRQLPLAIAILLGTRLPGGIVMPLPPPFLDLSSEETAKLESANLDRLRKAADFLGIDVHGSSSASGIVSTIELSSRPDAGLLLWIAVLFLALVLVYLAPRVRTEGLVAAGALLLALSLDSPGRVLLLGALAAVELVLVAMAFRRNALAVLAGSMLVVAISAVRFVLGGKFIFLIFKFTSPLIAIGGAFIFWKLRGKRAPVTGVLVWAVPLSLVALGILQPIEIVPSLLCMVFLAALLTHGISELKSLGLTIALLAFFLFSQRYGFGWTGERIGARYLYAMIAGGAVACLPASWAGKHSRRVVIAVLCLIPLWAFGYLHISRMYDTEMIQGTLAVLGAAACLAFSHKIGALKLSLIPVLAGLLQHLFPSVSLFWVVLGVHGGAGFFTGGRRNAIAALLLSVLFLMSPGAEFLSVLLFCLVPFVLLDERATLVLGAALATYVRYGIFDSFGHSSGAPYSLGNLDLRSGFAAITDSVNVWTPAALIVGKMVAASTLVYLLVFAPLSSKRLAEREGGVLLASLAVMLIFVLEAAIELGLSFGKNDARLSMSMIQMIIQGGLLVTMALGYGAYRLAMLGEERRVRA